MGVSPLQAERIKRVCDYIERNLDDEAISLATLSDVALCS